MLSTLQKYTTLVLFFFSFSFTTHAAVMIYEVYGAGGNTGAIYQDDFIVLYNSGPSAQSINGWSLQYASASGTSWDVLSLPNTSIAANSYYFIKLSTNGANGAALPATDLTTNALGFSTSGISATQGKLALMGNTTTISGSDPQVAPNSGVIDFVGYGGANASEGSPAPGPSTTSVIYRTSGTDTNNNSSDFSERDQTSVTTFPVKLTSFSARQTGILSTLNWQTASETNNEGFAVQRSSDAKSFETIGIVKGQNEKSEYSFLDTRPFEGYNYYRLEQKDFDGSKTLSKIIAVLFLPDGEVKVFPNPAVAGDNITISGLTSEGNFEVFKINGQKVPTASQKDQLRLNSGEYFIKVFHPYGYESKRLIVR